MNVLQYLEGFFFGDQRADPAIDIYGAAKFHVQLSFKGKVPLNSLSIIVSCYEKEDLQKPIEFSIKWCKIIDQDVYEIKDYPFPYYHVNPSDIDLNIRAVVTSKSVTCPGSLIVTIGPIVIDGSMKPELEGLIMNKEASFKCTVMSLNKEKVSPNLTVIKIAKPFLEIFFDQKMVAREPESNRSKFQNVKSNFEMDHSVKVKIDSQNINNAYVEFDRDEERFQFLVKFDNRTQRDIFCIFFKLMRMLRSKILENRDTEYDEMLTMPWCFLNIQTERYSEEAVSGYEAIYGQDAIREALKSMVRLNKYLQEENQQLVDSLDIIEQDLKFSQQEFAGLLEDGKAKNTKNIRKYEKSHTSIIQESSMVLEGVKEKNKKKRKANDDSIVEATRAIEDELASVKKINEVLKREIEVHKSNPLNMVVGTGSSTAGQKMESLYLSVIQVRLIHLENRRKFGHYQEENNCGHH